MVTRMDLRAEIIVFADPTTDYQLSLCAKDNAREDQIMGLGSEATKWHFPCFSLNSQFACCSTKNQVTPFVPMDLYNCFQKLCQFEELSSNSQSVKGNQVYSFDLYGGPAAYNSASKKLGIYRLTTKKCINDAFKEATSPYDLKFGTGFWAR
jgi:hypothetical protein